MKCKIIIPLMSLAAFFILLAGCTDPQLSTQMKELNIKMESMENKMDTLSNNVGNLDSEFANLKKSFDMINSVFQIEVDNFKESSENLDRELQEISNMKRRFSDLEKNINQFDNRLDRINQQLAQLRDSHTPITEAAPGRRSTVGSYYDIDSAAPVMDTYVVRRGDTLSSIAQRYNTTVNAIKAANNLRSDTIQIGQRLSIPNN